MVAHEFMTFVEKFHVISYVGLEDMSDKLSFLITVTMLLASTIFVTSKTYVISPLYCFAPVTPSGLKFEEYAQNFCWSTGSYAILQNETIPSTAAQWKAIEHLKIDYYQYIPFVLSVMCACFYFPRILWQVFCYKKLGVDMETLIQKANTARFENEGKKDAKPISDKIESILYCHRDFRQGKVSNARRYFSDMLGVVMASKRLGTWLSFWYFVMKFGYLFNAICQLTLISKMFGAHNNFLSFAWEMFSNLRNSIEWKASRIFPRVTYCYLNNIISTGQSDNGYVAQCALPQNMLNEKMFMFFFFWILFVAIITIISIMIWMKRMFLCSRIQFVKKFLKLDESYGIHKRESVVKFVTEFLQHDGFLVLEMIYLNSGDLITTAIVANLFEAYESKYINKDFRNRPYYLITDYAENNMAVKLAPAMSSAKKNPTAPVDNSEFV